MEMGFAIWITGLPASGKSSITTELVRALDEQGVKSVVLESDKMRKVLTPVPAYTAEERDRFYRALAKMGEIISRRGIPVVFDATANRRAYRDYARSLFPQFAEVLVDCPLELCKQRDPKGIYAKAAEGRADSVPGVQAPFEPPLRPELVLDCRISPSENARAIINKLAELGCLP